MRHAPNISFRVGPRNFRVHVGSRDELRAIVETVGEIDAISAFRKQWPANGIADEADVLRYVRLLSLLATDSKNGYGAIPVLFPLLNSTGEYPDPSGSLEVSDALELAYRLRAVFRENVPIDIRDTDDLLRAKQSVMQAQADNVAFGPADAQIHGLLRQFVVGSDLLLPARAGKENSAAY
jgi:hypothetical protein